MIRDELIEAGARAWHADSWKIDGDSVAAIVDAVEPLIRADERGRQAAASVAVDEFLIDNVKRIIITELRAEVQVMKDEAGQALLYAETHDEVTAASVGISVLDDVLSLLDGGSDGSR